MQEPLAEGGAPGKAAGLPCQQPAFLRTFLFKPNIHSTNRGHLPPGCWEKELVTQASLLCESVWSQLGALPAGALLPLALVERPSHSPLLCYTLPGSSSVPKLCPLPSTPPEKPGLSSPTAPVHPAWCRVVFGRPRSLAVHLGWSPRCRVCQGGLGCVRDRRALRPPPPYLTDEASQQGTCLPRAPQPARWVMGRCDRLWSPGPPGKDPDSSSVAM